MDGNHFGYITKLKKIPTWGYPNTIRIAQLVPSTILFGRSAFEFMLVWDNKLVFGQNMCTKCNTLLDPTNATEQYDIHVVIDQIK